MTYYLGIDFGTSGARGVAIDGEEKICWEFQYPFAVSGDWVAVWRKALFSILEQIPFRIKGEMRAIAKKCRGRCYCAKSKILCGWTNPD
ncbi:hypothetical protein [Lusitaniella coriacea]|uniref:hypothetical protein n=1 Tax=Lusitaniella coriacea TaxID=1983105 RepID=UPI001E310B58|nr:hypothetical protein [Lusitaniella coriacea]